jgi:hypothetical protein
MQRPNSVRRKNKLGKSFPGGKTLPFDVTDWIKVKAESESKCSF